MSTRYGKNEWEIRDGDFKMKEKFKKKKGKKKVSTPFSQKKEIVISRRAHSQRRKFHLCALVEILRRDRAVESDWIIRESGRLGVEGINRCLLTKLRIRSRRRTIGEQQIRERGRRYKLFDLFKFLASVLNFVSRFVIPFARRESRRPRRQRPWERILVLKVVASANVGDFCCWTVLITSLPLSTF